MDFSEIPKKITGGLAAIISPTGSGKSLLLKNILAKTHNEYDEFHMISPTARLQKDYDYFPRECIQDEFNEEFMLSLWKKQEKLILEGKKVKKILIILDDIIHDPAFLRSTAMKKMATGARHTFITIYLLSQHITSLRPILRVNLRLVIAFEFDNSYQLKFFVEQFLDSVNARVGKFLFKRITKTKYQAIIISIHKKGDPICEKVSSYIADPDIKIDMKKKEEKTVGVIVKKNPEIVKSLNRKYKYMYN